MRLPDLSQYDYVALLTSGPHPGRTLLGCGGKHTLVKRAGEGAFDALQVLLAQNEWVFSILGYDLRLEIERLPNTNPSTLDLPDLVAFVPEHLWEWNEGEWKVVVGDELQPPSAPLSPKTSLDFTLQPSVEPERYMADVERMLHHIQHGDIYEVNYTQEFSATGVDADPQALFERVHELTQAPFSTFFKTPFGSLACGSPERFLKKTGKQVISQPIKGTAKRSADPIEDAALAEHLFNDPKERSENVMITDLVRNDLSRVADRGSVEVKELCKVYSFKTVHQLISTVACEVSDYNAIDIVRACFPMGSMTGAPKIRAMELIDQVEPYRRGWYAGAAGYFAPNGDFDLNVIIRSLVYQQKTGKLTGAVGGAITSESNPEAEYAESLLKFEALQKAGGHVV